MRISNVNLYQILPVLKLSIGDDGDKGYFNRISRPNQLA